ncbi:Ubiquinone/menaquinone biosynthesis C-methylase UbiE [Amycolatopsis arida]|uniref:Ubiquinone/menaquinone biosynthesis C-methylase UbiE n=1 Tax=Amycolatopsis arida TaxID=587909 RepID=A0A1I5KJA3_9PSEU|nr:class I SAM-dependent methyltransferase [Amycolatopsis arida]TDX97074.1 ubiquinone/menaquinone biosynthesis C-methylase UbiE [Amycolatopsis arida]SFO85105.1 Ubiquinone/menaquinone biosynthesis C-methylase UbiE [Amycolatopsis arida]
MTESIGVRVDPANSDQLRAWDGATGAYWAERAERFDEGVAEYQGPLLDAAAVDTTARVLDVGCGSGRLTRDLATRATAGSALGMDLSAPMLELARGLAERERLANVTFQQADAQVHPFPDEHFDLIASRHGVMFFGDPRTAFANLARATRRGGRLVLLTWQPPERNPWIGAFRAALAAGRELPPPPTEAPSPFSLSDPDQVRGLLTSAGLTEVRLRGLTAPMYFGRDVDDAARFVTGQHAGMLEGLDAAGRARALDDLRATLADHRTERGVRYDSACWLVEARRP